MPLSAVTGLFVVQCAERTAPGATLQADVLDPVIQVLQAELPARVSRVRRMDKPLNPYVVLAVGPDGQAPHKARA